MRVLYILVFLFWSTCSVAAQDLGSLTGKVETGDGEILFGANVVVKGPTIEGTRGAITNEQGIYRIDRLPPGIYEITISYIGYETTVVTGVEIRAAESITRDFKLTAVALIGQQVVVSASRKQEKALDAPASISIVDASEIRNREVLTMSEYVKTLPGVDYAQTGISQGSMVIRGFNSVFSGTLLTLVDNRIARIPSLRLNAYNMIPLTSDDIERIEIVLGPDPRFTAPTAPMASCTSSPARHLDQKAIPFPYQAASAVCEKYHCGTPAASTTRLGSKSRADMLQPMTGNTSIPWKWKHADLIHAIIAQKIQVENLDSIFDQQMT